ncbi:Siroheme synthase [bioreactor metagenome]|uniref:precorrin-2 dehydrogenase n=1 Tax=bioreactor metagenome TaxID=1076179 RepID=A0A645GUL8_9ZZZZ
MVIAATNDVETNRFIAKIARERDIHVNVVDLNDQCSFYFPSVYKNGSICIGITTEGKSPGISAVLREKIEECIPEFYGDMADRMGELRQNIKEKFTSQNKRREILGTILKKMVETNNNITDEEIQRLIEGYYED